MSDHGARPWWADVQHLRPRDEHGADRPSSRFPRTRRPAEARPAAVATLEHDLPADPWGEGELPDVWAPDPHPEPAAEAPAPVWDDRLEDAFASAPSWAADEAWLLPKGADRIENGRRTIEIRGQVDRIVGVTAPAETAGATRTGRRRPATPVAARLAGRPDRVAMWAFLLGVLLILVAAFSGQADAGAAGALLAP
jgi:hypothetical protein